ncbi:dipeptidase [Paenibacillus cremeus]|uniref:Membrane dipeptidase n=1 Tax=Paenibacillus cremeus TaxID=2163881 RepID=A0A559KEM6_9BACL|nr:dipeptidase [Paenibacillus cremeus]TVY10580.1 membrane dipeptidase [Paenibacillus cremeus]
MRIIDGHCDVLYKMFENPSINYFDPSAALDASYAKMMKSGVKIQFFAIYLPERITAPKFDHYLEYINIFYQKIVRDGVVQVIKNRDDLASVMSSNKLGAILTLEGTDALEANPLYTRTLYHLGVRFIGVTWNYGNWAADGILEPRQGGFSRRGKSFIKDCGDLGILLDASHLSVASFWDLAAASTKSFVATHSNVKSLCPHPRNLDDDQIRELLRRDGRIGITFVPHFVHPSAPTIDALIGHVDHICSMGGERHIVFGSDFDGISSWIPGLEHSGQYGHLADALSKKYSSEQVERFLYGNWLSYLQKNLPIH